MPSSEGTEGGHRPDRRAMARPERAVAQALEEIGSLRERARMAEDRVRRLEDLLDGQEETGEGPGRLVDRLEVVEAENRELRDRLEEGREVVDRLLSRIRFLEEQG